MGKLIVTFFAVLFLLEGAQAVGGLGEDCIGAPVVGRRLLTGTCNIGLACDADDNKCKIVPGGACDPVEDLCSDVSFCDENCMICKVKAGEVCTEGVLAHCLWHGTCNGGTCDCIDDYTANEDKTECSGGLAGAVVSLTLMTVSFLASQLF